MTSAATFVNLLVSAPTGDQWVQANEEPVEVNQYRVRGLPVGEKMLFRVVAVNVAGRSPPATLSQAVTIKEIMGQRCTLTEPRRCRC